jgi:hypothetical protein
VLLLALAFIIERLRRDIIERMNGEDAPREVPA